MLGYRLSAGNELSASVSGAAFCYLGASRRQKGGGGDPIRIVSPALLESQALDPVLQSRPLTTQFQEEGWSGLEEEQEASARSHHMTVFAARRPARRIWLYAGLGGAGRDGRDGAG